MLTHYLQGTQTDISRLILSIVKVSKLSTPVCSACVILEVIQRGPRPAIRRSSAHLDIAPPLLLIGPRQASPPLPWVIGTFAVNSPVSLSSL